MPLYTNHATVAGEVRERRRERETERGEERGEERERRSTRSRARAHPRPALSLSLSPSVTQVKIAPQPGRRLEHAGIKIQLIGRIELAADRGTKHDFLKLGARGMDG